MLSNLELAYAPGADSTVQFYQVISDFGTEGNEFEAYTWGSAGGGLAGDAQDLRITDGLQAYLQYIAPGVTHICEREDPNTVFPGDQP